MSRKISLILILVLSGALIAALLTGCMAETVKIEFDSDGGSFVSPITVTEDMDRVSEPEPPTKDGHRFLGWYVDSERTEEFNFLTVPTNTVTVYALWEEDAVLVTFKSKLDSQAESEYYTFTMGVTYGTAITLPAVPKHEGYNGVWVTEGLNIARVTKPITIYAKFTLKTINITFDNRNQTENTVVTGTMDKLYSLPQTPTLANHIFAGWYTDLGNSREFNFTGKMPADSVTVYARWLSEQQLYTYFNYQVVNGSDVRITSITRAATHINEIFIPEKIRGYTVRYLGYDNAESSVFASDKLSRVHIPATVEYIGKAAFSDAPALKQVVFALGSQLTKIADSAFRGCTLIEQFSLPSTVEYIGSFAFAKKESGENMGLMYLHLDAAQSALSFIGQRAFDGCMSLASMPLSFSYTEYDYRSFLNTALVRFTLPIQHTHFSVDGGVLYSKNAETLIAYPAAANAYSPNDTGSGNYSVKPTTKYIADYAFFGNTRLKAVALSDALISIGISSFQNTALETVAFGSALTSVKRYAFYQSDKISSLTLPASVVTIGDYAFAEMSQLTSVNLGENLINFGTSAFENCVSLNDISIPASLIKIPNRAFYGCTQINISFASGSILEEIGDYAFYGCVALNVVTFPSEMKKLGAYAFAVADDAPVKMQLRDVYINDDNLAEIGDYAFANCISLLQINLRRGTAYIGEGAFYNCVSLNNVVFNGSINSLTEIAAKTFYNCVSIVSITLPYSVKKIGDYAFYNNRKLTSLTAGSTASPAPITEIGKSAFENCVALNYAEGTTNQRVIFPQTQKIGDRAFYNCTNLVRIAIPNTLTEVGKEVFAYNTSLTTITFTATSLSYLGEDMFKGCTKLTSFTVPSSVTSFQGNPFYGCTSLTVITAESGNMAFIGKTLAGAASMLLSADQTEIALFPTGISGSHTVSGDIIGIADYAFYGSALTSLTVPDAAGTFYIGKFAFASSASLAEVRLASRVNQIGEGAFLGNSRLTSVTIDGGEYALSIGASAFAETGISSIHIPERTRDIGDYAFDSVPTLDSVNFGAASDPLTIGSYAFRMARLTAVAFPSNLISIGEGAFSWNVSLASITWGEGETPLAIGKSAFENCHSLISLRLPARLESLGEYAFASNLRLEEVYVDGNKPEIAERAFYLNVRLRAATFSANVDTIGERMFEGANLLSEINFDSRENAIIIGDYAFYGCNSLREFTVHKDIQGIGEYAFASSALALLDFDLGSDLTIGAHAFQNTQLVTLYLSSRVTEMGSYAFAENKKLSSVEFSSDSAMAIGDYAFYAIGSSAGNIEISLPEGITAIGEYAFADIYQLVSFIFEGGEQSKLEVLGKGAFENARGLTAIRLPHNLKVIGERSFYRATNLSSVTILNTSAYDIGDFAFANCAMERMDLGKVKYIEGTPFYGSMRLAILTVDVDNANYKTADNVLYSKNVEIEGTTYGDNELLVSYPAGKTGAVYSVLNSAKAFSDYAFSGNKYLSSVIITSGLNNEGEIEVLSIKENTFTGLGIDLKFIIKNKSISVLNNDELSSAYKAAPFWQDISDKIFTSEVTVDDFTVELLTGDSFNCRIISYVGITESVLHIPTTLGGWYVKEIGADAFRNNNRLREIYLPSGLTAIGDYAFASCLALQKVQISESVNTIGNGAFWGCENLTSVIFGANSTLTEISKHTFENCYALTSINIPAKVETIGAFAFAGTYLKPMALEIVSFASRSALKTIGNNAFQYCVNLNSITLPAKLENLRMRAFYGCVSLTSVVLDKHSDDDPILNLENGKVFEETPKELIIYIDAVLLRDYNKARFWKEIASQLSQSESIQGDYSVEETTDNYTVIVISQYLGIYDATSGTYDKSKISEYQSNIPEILDNKPVVLFDQASKTLSQRIADEVHTLDYDSRQFVSGKNFVIEIDGEQSRKHTVFAEVYNVSLRGVRILKYLGVSQSLTVPKKINNKQVLSLGGYSINSKVKNITLPYGLMTINSHAFSYASALETAVLPLTLQNIGEYAFSGTKLRALGFGDINNVRAEYSMLKNIGGFAFYNSMYFGEREFVIPSRVQAVGTYAFAGAEGQMDVKNFRFLGSEMNIIENYAFAHTKVVSVTLPALLNTLGEGVFKGSVDLLTVFIPNAGTASKIVNFTVNAVETFGGCHYVKVYVPQEKVVLYRNAWGAQNMSSRIYADTSLFTVDLGEGKEGNFAINVTNTDREYAELIQYFGAEEVVIPDRINGFTITSISNYAFNNTVTKVTLPQAVGVISSFAFYMSSVEEVYFAEDSQLREIGANSFYGTNVKEIEIPFSVRTILQSAFESSALEVLRFEKSDLVTDIDEEGLSISSSVFTKSALREAYLPKRLVSIGTNAFAYTEKLSKLLLVSEAIWTRLNDNIYEIDELVQASHLETIEASAFYGCVSLKDVYLPFHIKQIKETVFANCTALQRVVMLGGNYGSEAPAGFSLPLLSAGVFNNINNPFFKIYVPQNSYESYRGASIWNGYASANTDYIITNQLHGDFAYRMSEGGVIITKYLGSAKHVTIPATLTINSTSFNVRGVGPHFLNNTVETVVMQEGVVSQTVAKYAFAQTPNLAKVSLSSKVVTLGEYVFYNCVSLRSVTLPTAINLIPTHAFDGCESLESLSLPASITSIDSYAFNGCKTLYRLIIETPVSGNQVLIEPSSSMLQNTSPYLKIFVNSNFLSAYKGKTGWSEHSSKILVDDCLYGDFTIEIKSSGEVTIYQFVGIGDVRIPSSLMGGKVVKIETNAIIPGINVILPAGSTITYGQDLVGRVFYEDE